MLHLWYDRSSCFTCDTVRTTGRWITPYTRASSWTCSSTTCCRTDWTPIPQQQQQLSPIQIPFANAIPLLSHLARDMQMRATIAEKLIPTGLVSTCISSCLHQRNPPHLTILYVAWALTAEVFNTAVLRCPCDCAICMLPIHCSQYAPTALTVSGSSASRRDVLLSCSHLFHEKCILSFERFLTATAVSGTPTCRLFLTVSVPSHSLLCPMTTLIVLLEPEQQLSCVS